MLPIFLYLAVVTYSLNKHIRFEDEIYTLYASKIINPEKVVVFEEYNITRTVRVPVVSIGIYYRHSNRDECSLILVRIDAKRAPNDKLRNALIKKFTVSNDEDVHCGHIYSGEQSLYQNELEKSVNNIIKDLIKNDEIFIKACPSKIQIFVRESQTSISINDKIFCRIKKRIQDF
jgi:hypothetical protein